MPLHLSAQAPSLLRGDGLTIFSLTMVLEECFRDARRVAGFFLDLVVALSAVVLHGDELTRIERSGDDVAHALEVRARQLV